MGILGKNDMPDWCDAAIEESEDRTHEYISHCTGEPIYCWLSYVKEKFVKHIGDNHGK